MYSCRAPGSCAAKGTATNFRARARRQEVVKEMLLLPLYTKAEVEGRRDDWVSVLEKKRKLHVLSAKAPGERMPLGAAGFVDGNF